MFTCSVHKKICIPLPGLFQRGRLYKAQSCGSIVRDKVNQNIHNNPPPNTTRHSVLFTEKGKILRNCLGGKFLGNSDGDINQNNGKHNKLSSSLLFTIPTSSKPSSVAAAIVSTTTPSPAAQSCNLPSKKPLSPLHQLSDVPLCSSKC